MHCNVETNDTTIVIEAISIAHERFGFELRERHNLKKVKNESSICYEVCDKEVATEKFFLDIIELSKEDFVIATKANVSRKSE